MENVKNNDEIINNQNVKNSNNFTLPTDRAYVWLIVGKPGSGKTHFLKSIFYDYGTIKHFKFGIRNETIFKTENISHQINIKEEANILKKRKQKSKFVNKNSENAKKREFSRFIPFEE